MRFLRKLNKGLVLTVLVLLVLVGYIIAVEIQRDKEKPEIQKVCNEYLSFLNKYLVFPKENITLGKAMPDEQYNKHVDGLKQELAKFTLNENILQKQLKLIENNLSSQAIGVEKYNKYENKLLKISKYIFDGDSVTINYQIMVDSDRTYLDNPVFNHETNIYIGNEMTKDNVNTLEEIMILEKQDGKWKLVFSSNSMKVETKYEKEY